MNAQQITENAINEFGPIAEVYDQLVAWAPYDQWVQDLVARLRQHGLSRVGAILDVACGTGLSTFPLARLGYDVTGVDCSEPMLEQARRKAQENQIDVDFVQADLVEMRLRRRFDAVVCVHSGLDYILDLSTLQRAFHTAREHVKEGGLFAFDKCLDEPEFYRENTSNSRDLENGTAIFQYDWDASSKVFRQKCVVWRKGKGEERERTEVVHEMLAVPPEQLIDMVEQARFEVLEPPTQFSISDPGMGIFRAI